jgi:hypothetical protein
MSATADNNAHRDLLADFSTDPGDTAAHVLWPADPGQEESAGQLRIDLDDGHTPSGSPVTVEARLTIPGTEAVQAVVRVQGLEAAWCPLPQVVIVAPSAPARLFVELSPAPGTPPGRYLWSLTAEVRDRPMLATTAQLYVNRPTPAAPPTPPRSRWRPTRVLAVAVAALLVILAALTVFAPSWVFWGRDAATPRHARSAPGPSRVLPTAVPSQSPALAAKVLVKGTVLATEGKEPIEITVVRLSLNDLTGIHPAPAGPGGVPEAPTVEKRVRGKHWSLSLPPGLYGFTFSKPGYLPESIVVATAVADTVPAPHVRLVRIAPAPTGAAGP